jgi:transcriptional regulator
MFVPTQYKNENLAEVKSFLKANSFGILIHQYNNKPWGTHIPLVLDVNADGKEVLQGHVGKANPAASTLEDGMDVMVIFNGPHAYISSSLYDHDNVSTWNYVAVHVYGKVSILNAEGLASHLRKLVDHYESSMPNPKMYDSLGPAAMSQIRGIIGFEVVIEDIQAAYKLSQNRNDHDYLAITDHLTKSDHKGDVEMGILMKNQRKINEDRSTICEY